MAILTLKLLALGFVAGFLATLLFHQGVWFLLNQAGIIPADRPAWPTDPIPPFGVQSVNSKAFWGGLWGMALAPLLAHLSGASYWASWILVGAVALTLVAFLVVPALKGEAMPAPLWPRFGVGLLVNGAWGLGTGLFLWLLGAASP
jgi:hypothetical protein